MKDWTIVSKKSPRPTETHIEGDLYKHTTANFHGEHETKQHEAFKDVSDSSISPQICGCSEFKESETNKHDPSRYFF